MLKLKALHFINLNKYFSLWITFGFLNIENVWKVLNQSNNCSCFISERRTWEGDADFPSAYDAKGDRRNRRSDENYSGPDCTWSMVVWWPTSPWACRGQWARGRKHEWSRRFVSESSDQWGGREQAKRRSVHWLVSLTRTRWLLFASLCEKCTISPWLIEKNKACDAVFRSNQTFPRKRLQCVIQNNKTK